MAQSLKSPDVVTTLAVQGASPGAMDTAQFSDYVKSEVKKWGELVRLTGAKAD